MAAGGGVGAICCCFAKVADGKVFLELHEGARATPPSISAAARVEAVRACVREERREERDTAEAYMCPCFSECLMSDGVDVCECLASLFVSSHDYDCDRDYHPSF